jgi:hypothetical protein
MKDTKNMVEQRTASARIVDWSSRLRESLCTVLVAIP